MSVLLFLAIAATPTPRQAPSVPPAGAFGYASVRIMRAVEIGPDQPPPAMLFQVRNERLKLADGSVRLLRTYELE